MTWISFKKFLNYTCFQSAFEQQYNIDVKNKNGQQMHSSEGKKINEVDDLDLLKLSNLIFSVKIS